MLLDLLFELQLEIAAQLELTGDKSTLVRICRKCYDELNTDLYRHVAQSKDEARKAMVWTVLNGWESACRNC
jgi:hypothetical protein